MSAIGHAVLDVAAIIGVVALLAVITITAAGVMAVRAARRRWRAWRRSGDAPAPTRSRGVVTETAKQAVTAYAVTTASSLSSPQWWTVQLARRRMWKAVSAATHAVSVARRSGAPVGDLPTLANQLSSAARSVDALARAAGRTPAGHASSTVELGRIEQAALQLHRAALDSLTTVAAAEVGPLESAVQLEAVALAAGVRAPTT